MFQATWLPELDELLTLLFQTMKRPLLVVCELLALFDKSRIQFTK